MVVFYLSIRCQYKFVGKDMWLMYWMHADKLHAISKQYILWFLSGTRDQTMACVLHDVNIQSNFYLSKIKLLDASGTITSLYFCYFNRVPWPNVNGIFESYLANTWYGRIIKWQKKQYYRSLCIGAVYLSWLIINRQNMRLFTCSVIQYTRPSIISEEENETLFQSCLTDPWCFHIVAMAGP